MDKRSQKVRFRPGDTNYRWNDDRESPFLKRSVINYLFDAKTKAKSVKIQQQYYELLFKNENEPFLSRNQGSQPKEPSSSTDARFLDEQNLLGNVRQIEFSMTRILDQLIKNLENDPQQLFLEADKLKNLCQEVGFEIPAIETFNRLSNWEEFMDLLRSLKKKKYRFKFELLIAAITQYAALCSG